LLAPATLPSAGERGAQPAALFIFNRCHPALSEEQHTVPYYRRATPRIEAPKDVYAFWNCNGGSDLSRVRNLNLGGMFLETSIRKNPGAHLDLSFLVSDGQIRATAVVRHVSPGQGLGLQFLALEGKDRLRFGAMMKRMYAESGRGLTCVPKL
jgi:hypothetical protein